MRYAGLGLHKYTGELDKHLPQMVSGLAKHLSKFQGNIANRYLRLKTKHLKDLAGVLVDFAADVHTNTGICVFLNPDGGKEIMQNFNCLQSTFSRKGVNLTEDEEEAVMDFLCSDIISSAFVKRMALEYGPDSIKYTFSITNMTKDY